MNNKLMRLASVLLIAALITTCAISGTFAKYVTKVEHQDSARVAKWGVTLSLEGDGLFATEYDTDEEVDPQTGFGYTGVSVRASDEDKVVAPGTTSLKEDASGNPIHGFVATVAGTPEVATRYVLEIPEWSDIILPAGEYTDYTQLVDDGNGNYDYTETFTLPIDYTPVKWNITISKGNTSISLVQALAAVPQLAQLVNASDLGVSFTDLKAAIETYGDDIADALEGLVSGAQNPRFEVSPDGAILLSMDFEPNKVMDFEFDLDWAWAYEVLDGNGEVIDLVDKADAYLGHVAAGTVVDADVCTDFAFQFTASATQID